MLAPVAFYNSRGTPKSFLQRWVSFIAKLLCIALVLVLLGGAVIGYFYIKPSYLTATVTSTAIKQYDSRDKFLVFTDRGTFEITDTWLYWQFRSADVYGSFRKDQCYRLKVYGFRLPFYSMFRNIVKAEPVTCN